MTIHVPNVEEWSNPLKVGDELTQKLAADEKTLEAEVQRLLPMQGSDNTRRARAEIIAAGGTPDIPDTNQQLSEAVTQLGDIRLANKIHRDKMKGIRQREGERLCHEIKPAYDALAKRQATGMSDLYETQAEIFALECKLRGQGIGFYPIVCNIDSARVFGEPNDPGSHFANLLRECVKFGHLSKLPKGLK
jgi:hypothetical protein